MKRLLAIILVLLLFIPETVAFAANIDWKSMSDQEITDAIDAGRLELASRMPDSEDHVTIVNQDGVEVYLTRRYSIDDGYSSGSVYLRLEAVVVNNTDMILNIVDNGTCVNGWNVDTSGIYQTGAGRKQKGDIVLRISDAFLTSPAEVTDVEFVLRAYDENDYSKKIEFAPFTYVR